MREVRQVAGREVVDAEDRVPGELGEQGVGQVGAEEARGPGDENFLLLHRTYTVRTVPAVASSTSRAGYTAGRPTLM